jgi:hypothetical protein
MLIRVYLFYKELIMTDDLDQSLPSTLIIFMQQMGIRPKLAARVVHQVPWVPTSDCQEPPF